MISLLKQLTFLGACMILEKAEEDLSLVPKFGTAGLRAIVTVRLESFVSLIER